MEAAKAAKDLERDRQIEEEKKGIVNHRVIEEQAIKKKLSALNLTIKEVNW